MGSPVLETVEPRTDGEPVEVRLIRVVVTGIGEIQDELINDILNYRNPCDDQATALIKRRPLGDLVPVRGQPRRCGR